jgi:nucleoside-diphosphate-sugar epimerase
MRIAIRDGTGFVGHHVAVRVCAEGHQVALLARRTGDDLVALDGRRGGLAGGGATARGPRSRDAVLGRVDPGRPARARGLRAPRPSLVPGVMS